MTLFTIVILYIIVIIFLMIVIIIIFYIIITADGAVDGTADGAVDISLVNNSLMTSKLKRLVEELRKLQTSDVTAKCLVFSQFSQVR